MVRSLARLFLFYSSGSIFRLQRPEWDFFAQKQKPPYSGGSDGNFYRHHQFIYFSRRFFLWEVDNYEIKDQLTKFQTNSDIET